MALKHIYMYIRHIIQSITYIFFRKCCFLCLIYSCPCGSFDPPSFDFFHLLFPISFLSPVSMVTETATPPWHVSLPYKSKKKNSFISCLLMPYVPFHRYIWHPKHLPWDLTLSRLREKNQSFCLSRICSFQCWWPTYSLTTWAGAAVKSALHRHAEQHAASLLTPHDPDVRLWLLYKWGHSRGVTDKATQLSGAPDCRRASSWHLSDFLQWAHTQRHWGLGSGR